MLHSYNQQSRGTREQVSKLLSFSRSFSFLKLSSKKKLKKKKKRYSVARSNALPTIVVATPRGAARCRPAPQQRREL